jgi:hypothetical protein
MEATVEVWATLLFTLVMVSSATAEKGEFAWRNLGAGLAEAEKPTKWFSLIFIQTGEPGARNWTLMSCQKRFERVVFIRGAALKNQQSIWGWIKGD